MTVPALDPDMWIFISAWVFASVAIGLASGFMIGRWYTLAHEPKKLQQDRDRTLVALMSVMSSADKLNEDVDVHNEALAVAQDDISQIKASGEVGKLQGQLLKSVTHMVEANRKLENELNVTRYKLEEQAQVLDETKKEARTDALCELGNRKAFDETIKAAVSQMQIDGQSCGLMLVDVDHFKRINDTFGHAAGDRVLVSIGQSLMSCIRPNDLVFRIGGDEFGILLREVSSDNVAAVAKRIRGDIELCEFDVDSESTVVTLSMGLTVAESKDTPESFFVRADEALYYSKEHGRNRLTTKVANRTQEFAPENKETPAEDEAPSYSSYEEFKAMAHASEAPPTA